MGNNQNQIWRCPDCETINKEAVCTVCGAKKPKITQKNNQYTTGNNQTSLNETYNEQTTNKSNHEFQNKKVISINKTIGGLLIFIWMLVIIILVFAIIMLVNSNSKSENNTIADSNARMVYSNALRYCVQCITNDEAVTDGEYIGDLTTKLSAYTFDGTKEDLDEYLSHMIGGSANAGFFKLSIKNGIPESAQWSITNNFDELSENLNIGKYPIYGVLNTNEISMVAIANHTDEIVDANVTEDVPEIITANISEEPKVSEVEKGFDENIFCYQLMDCINSERKELGCAALSYNVELEDIITSFMNDYKSGNYIKGTMKEYYEDSYNDFQSYYEETFDLKKYPDERQAAKALLKYETENFSNDWIYSKWEYCGVAVSENDDGTYFVTWGMACENERMESETQSKDNYITIKNTLYPIWLTELDISGLNLTDADIVDLDKMINLKTLYLHENNIENIDVLKSLTSLEYLCLRDNDITDVKSLCNLKNLKELYLQNNNISDVSDLEELTSLNNLDLCGNYIDEEEVKLLQKVLKKCAVCYENHMVEYYDAQDDYAPIAD